MFTYQPDVSFIEMFRSLVESKPAGYCKLDEQINFRGYDCQVVGISEKYILLGFKMKPYNVQTFYNQGNKWPNWISYFSKNLRHSNFFYFIKSSDIIAIH